MKWAYEEKEKIIGMLLFGGVAAFLFGGFCCLMGFVLRAQILFALGPFLMFLGMCSTGVGLYLGFAHNRNIVAGAARPDQEGRISARYAINQIGEMIFDNFDYDAEEARFYVRVQYLDGKREELECARPVFDQCGEGMRGLLTINGGWLSRFAALPDTDQTRAAYKDW